MLARKYWHKSLTDEVIADAVEREMTTLDNPGFCLVCGVETEGVEPDAPQLQVRVLRRRAGLRRRGTAAPPRLTDHTQDQGTRRGRGASGLRADVRFGPA